MGAAASSTLPSSPGMASRPSSLSMYTGGGDLPEEASQLHASASSDEATGTNRYYADQQQQGELLSRPRIIVIAR
jgi:hypothetical protein